jgi:hypothetical protein
MIVKKSLAIFFRTHIWKQYLQVSSMSSNVKSVIPTETLIEESEETLNPDICNLLCSLCAPGTESFNIQKNVTEMVPLYEATKKPEVDLNTLVTNTHNNSNVSQLFIHKTGALHVTYVEPALSTK